MKLLITKSQLLSQVALILHLQQHNFVLQPVDAKNSYQNFGQETVSVPDSELRAIDQTMLSGSLIQTPHPAIFIFPSTSMVSFFIFGKKCPISGL